VQSMGHRLGSRNLHHLNSDTRNLVGRTLFSEREDKALRHYLYGHLRYVFLGTEKDLILNLLKTRKPG
jgi:hypothetical protein